MANYVKAIKAAMRPGNWNAMIRGVVPTIEHGDGLRHISPKTVMDVGANRGQFSVFATQFWPDADFHAFEPLPKPAARLESILGKKVTLHRCALGDKNTELDIHIASRDDSSSLLPLGDKQKALYGMNQVGMLKVPVKRLDNAVVAENIRSPALLKIDVQGFEYEVLCGLGTIVDKIRWIYVEASFVELYDGQRLFSDVELLIKSLGYQEIGQFNKSSDKEGRIVQADFLFEKSPH